MTCGPPYARTRGARSAPKFQRAYLRYLRYLQGAAALLQSQTMQVATQVPQVAFSGAAKPKPSREALKTPFRVLRGRNAGSGRYL
jgi:hypothetical protein